MVTTSTTRPAPIEAVLFDLDDTLFDQQEWLEGAWAAVAAALRDVGGPEVVQFCRALHAVAAGGTDQGDIIDQALDRCHVTGVSVAPLLHAFQQHAPERLCLFPGVEEGLAALRARGIALGLVTDGNVGPQRAKLRALNLVETFDAIVLSDEMGREHRKPDPLPFRTALGALGVGPTTTVFVGDRPDKDVDGSTACGMRAVRVRTGEYRAAPNRTEPWRDAADAAAAIRLVLDELSAVDRGRTRPASPVHATT